MQRRIPRLICHVDPEWFAAIVLLLALVATTMMVVDLRRAYRRIGQGSVVVPGPQGDIEFSQGGRGLPVLVVHGSGGGTTRALGARLLAFDTGGHLLMAVEQSAIRAEVQAFIRAHAER